MSHRNFVRTTATDFMVTPQLITDYEQFNSLSAAWNTLAGGVPMRSAHWLATWWNYYGAPPAIRSNEPTDRELCVVAVYDAARPAADQLVGIAPWYLDRTLVRGNVLRWLASGEVCTDHQSLICRPEDAARVAAACAEFLANEYDEWDRLELSAVDDDDVPVAQLLDELERRDCLVSRQTTDNYWVVELPDQWDDYLATLSKSHRKQLRQCERRILESGRGDWHTVNNLDELHYGWRLLVELHQRRWRSLGQPGCFASRPFHNFHREVAERLLADGRLRMAWLELDGTPAVAEYHFAGPQTTYSYQSGVDPDRLKEGPGHLGNMLSIRRAIEDGHCVFDFLRGDEPYKAHWRAAPRPMGDYRVVPNRRLARLRGRVFQAADTVKDWVKQSVEMVCG